MLNQENLETAIAMQHMSLIANFLGFRNSEELMKNSRMVISPNLGLVGFLADLAMGNFPYSTYRIAHYDQFAEEHVKLFIDDGEAFDWLASTYRRFSIVKNW